MKKLWLIVGCILLLPAAVFSQDIELINKTFFAASAITFDYVSPELYVRFLGRCTFLDDGTVKFEKLDSPKATPKKSYQVLEYSSVKVRETTFLTINDKKYLLLNWIPGIYALSPGIDYGKGEGYGEQVKCFLISQEYMNRLYAVPAEPDEFPW